MRRREALSLAAVPLLLVVPGVATAAGNTVDYSRKTYDELLASGKPFMLDFYASW